MNYEINKQSHHAAYLQLYFQIRKDIITGAYEYGTKLPSKRIISAETGVSIITVEHALELLSDEGYVEMRQRSGCFCIYRAGDFQGVPFQNQESVAGRDNNITGGLLARTLLSGDDSEEVRETTKLPEDVFPYSVMARVMRRVLADMGERILVKSPNQGALELRNEICAYLARSRGMMIRPAQVVIGAGAEYLYGLIADLAGRDTIFALENPSYEKIGKVYSLAGIECVYIAMQKDGLDIQEIEQSGAGVLHVTPFNSYPSGVTASISKKHEYLGWAGRTGGIVVEDNYASELSVSTKMEDSIFSMATEERVIYLSSFSKTIAPSLRVGYMILPENMLEIYRELLGFYSCPVPVFEQLVLAQLLKNGDFERHVNRIRRQKRRSLND